jgi:hypothetical protein
VLGSLNYREKVSLKNSPVQFGPARWPVYLQGTQCGGFWGNNIVLLVSRNKTCPFLDEEEFLSTKLDGLTVKDALTLKSRILNHHNPPYPNI